MRIPKYYGWDTCQPRPRPRPSISDLQRVEVICLLHVIETKTSSGTVDPLALVQCLTLNLMKTFFVSLQPQSVPGLTTQQPMVQLPMGSVQPTAIIQPQVSTSQPSSIPAVAPPAPQYQWYQQMPPAVGSVAVSTPQAQTTPLQGTHPVSIIKLL